MNDSQASRQSFSTQTRRTALLPLFLVLLLGMVAVTLAQSGGSDRTKKDSSSRAGDLRSQKAVDLKARKLEQSFVRDAFDLAQEYEGLEQYEKSKQLLEAIRKLNDQLPGIDERIKVLDERLMESNAVELQIDAGGGWGKPVAQVFNGRPFRIQAAGTYKMTMTTTLDVNGLAEDNPITDLAPNVPLGALMGLILSPRNDSGGRRKGRKDETPRAFAIKAGTEITPNEDGQLFLKVNIPGDSRCTGRLDVKLSGFIRSN